MNWTRYKLLIISGGITLVLSIGLIFWIFTTRGKNQEVSDRIQNLNRRQSQLFSEKPYPSEKNFERLVSEQAQIREQRNQLKSLIREGQLQPRDITRARFGDYIKGPWINTLRTAAESATKGGEDGVILEDEYFSMSKFIEDDDLPETSEIPDLMLDLETISYLSRMLFNEGISELISVKADDPNQEKAANPNRFAPLGGFAANRAQAEEPADETVLSDLAQEKERLFNHKDYRIEFKVYEDFFWQLLNEIVSDQNIFVIKELYVTNSNDQLWPSYLEPVVGKRQTRRAARNSRAVRQPANDLERLLMRASDTNDDSRPTEQKKVKIAGLSERRQNVTGGDLLNVVLVVRNYRLIDETEENEQGS